MRTRLRFAIKQLKRFLYLSEKSLQESPTAAVSKVLLAVSEEGTCPDMILFGDSVVERVSKFDNDTRSLGTLLHDLCAPSFNIETVSCGGFHLGVFRALVQLVIKGPQTPSVLCIEINLRSFSPQWHRNPNWRYQDVIDAAQACLFEIGKPAENELVDFHARCEDFATYRTAQVSYVGTSMQSIDDFLRVIGSKPKSEEDQLSRRRAIFTFHYAFILEDTHPHLVALRGLLDVATKNGVKVFLFLTPINVGAGNRYLNSIFDETLRHNRAVISGSIQDFLSKQENLVRFVDYSDLLSSKDFFTEHEASEHLNEKGRTALARVLMTQLEVMTK